MTFNINFNDATVRKEEDLPRLAAEVQRLVEQGLGRKISSLGFGVAR